MTGEASPAVAHDGGSSDRNAAEALETRDTAPAVSSGLDPAGGSARDEQAVDDEVDVPQAQLAASVAQLRQLEADKRALEEELAAAREALQRSGLELQTKNALLAEGGGEQARELLAKLCAFDFLPLSVRELHKPEKPIGALLEGGAGQRTRTAALYEYAAFLSGTGGRAADEQLEGLLHLLELLLGRLARESATGGQLLGDARESRAYALLRRLHDARNPALAAFLRDPGPAQPRGRVRKDDAARRRGQEEEEGEEASGSAAAAEAAPGAPGRRGSRPLASADATAPAPPEAAEAPSEPRAAAAAAAAAVLSILPPGDVFRLDMPGPSAPSAPAGKAARPPAGGRKRKPIGARTLLEAEPQPPEPPPAYYQPPPPPPPSGWSPLPSPLQQQQQPGWHGSYSPAPRLAWQAPPFGFGPPQGGYPPPASFPSDPAYPFGQPYPLQLQAYPLQQAYPSPVPSPPYPPAAPFHPYGAPSPSNSVAAAPSALGGPFPYAAPPPDLPLAASPPASPPQAPSGPPSEARPPSARRTKNWPCPAPENGPAERPAKRRAGKRAQ